MAEGLARRMFGDRVFVDSCGLKQDSAAEGEGADPFVEAVMAELSIDLARHRAKTFDHVEADSFDLVISLTPEAQHRAVEMTRGRATEIEYWPIFDPTLATGSRDIRLLEYRQVREGLAERLRQRFQLPQGGG